MHEIVLNELNKYSSLNDESINIVLNQGSEKIDGLAREILQECLESLENGLSKWPDGWQEHKKRQENKKNTLYKALYEGVV